MIYILLSIIFSTSLVVIFRIYKNFNIDSFQAIVFNYITASSLGIIMSGGNIDIPTILNANWLMYALFLGILFIIIFNLLGYAVQTIGITPVAIAQKMSVVIPVLFAIIYFKESASFLKIAGMVLALFAIYFSSAKNSDSEKSKTNGMALYLLPIAIFIGSGIIDLIINYVRATKLNGEDPNLFTTMLFASAAICGISMLSFLIISGKQKIEFKNIIAGIALGIPNYASVIFLIKALENPQFESSVIFPINNIGIIMLNTFIAYLFFKEKLSVKNVIGIALSVIAILIISFSN